MKPRALVACEKSQKICIALRKIGIEAYSCDVQACSGGHPEWHIQEDAIYHVHKPWDLIIVHPPCTRLAVSGARWFKEPRTQKERWNSILFFMYFTNLECKRVCIENPVGIMSTVYRKPDQIIQPYEFGHPETKATCLWLKGLPLLIPTNIVEPVLGSRIHRLPPSKDRAEIRSVTYDGIAEAIAEQWGKLLLQEVMV